MSSNTKDDGGRRGVHFQAWLHPDKISTTGRPEIEAIEALEWIQNTQKDLLKRTPSYRTIACEGLIALRAAIDDGYDIRTQRQRVEEKIDMLLRVLDEKLDLLDSIDLDALARVQPEFDRQGFERKREYLRETQSKLSTDNLAGDVTGF